MNKDLKDHECDRTNKYRITRQYNLAYPHLGSFGTIRSWATNGWSTVVQGTTLKFCPFCGDELKEEELDGRKHT